MWVVAMDETTLFPEFEPVNGGAFLHRHGPGRQPDAKFSNKKLCFVATELHLLYELLLELSHRPDCYYVKFSRQPRDGMYMGRCFMTDDAAAGALWKEFKSHPRLMCAIQDDDFTKAFRESL